MKLRVAMGEVKVARPPHTLLAAGLGSCVAVVLYDEHAKVGGLAHVVLPTLMHERQENQPTRFADFAIQEMLRQMQAEGASIGAIKARVIGGANMFPEIIETGSTMNVGARNVFAVKQYLANYRIEITGEHTGRNVGRSVVLDTTDGSVVVRIARGHRAVR